MGFWEIRLIVASSMFMPLASQIMNHLPFLGPTVPSRMPKIVPRITFSSCRMSASERAAKAVSMSGQYTPHTADGLNTSSLKISIRLLADWF